MINTVEEFSKKQSSNPGPTVNDRLKRRLARIGCLMFSQRLENGLGLTAVAIPFVRPAIATEPFALGLKTAGLCLVLTGLGVRAFAAGFAGRHTRSSKSLAQKQNKDPSEQLLNGWLAFAAIRNHPTSPTVVSKETGELIFDLTSAYSAALLIAVLVAALGVWWITRKALQPLLEVAVAAEQIDARSLNQRLPELRTEDEVGRLVRVLNRSFDRLERSFKPATRFSSDASHELKTPLTIIRGEIELALKAEENSPRIQSLLDGLLAETQLFYRADPSRSSETNGSGLGLSICREIVAAHGGQMWLDQQASGWTAFIVTLSGPKSEPNFIPIIPETAERSPNQRTRPPCC